MGSKKPRVTGWVASIIVALFLMGPSALGKFVEWEGKAQMFEKLGITNDLTMKIGVLEIVLAVLFVIPRTGFLGAILLTGYFGGATMTHLRIGEPIFFPIILGVVIWICLGLRRPEVFALAIGKPSGGQTP
jgi:DoxX-like family